MMSDDLFQLVARYKFVLSIENGICHDYITEKLWRPLIAGSVPVYIGSPTVVDWLPNKRSAILGLDFQSPERLAEHLHKLNKNSEEYNSLLAHKLKSKIENEFLSESMKTRDYDTDSNGEKGAFVENFDCFVCKKLHNPEEERKVVTKDHYDCPMPLSVVSKVPNISNFWLDRWFYGRCEAQVIRRFVDLGVGNFTQQQFESSLEKLVVQGKCHYEQEHLDNI